MNIDIYNPRVAFDDIYGDEPEVTVDLAPIFREVAYRIARRTTPPVRFDIVNRTGATPSFARHLVDPDHFVVGEEAAKQFPIFSSCYQKFKEALPSTKIVRLEKRLSALEAAVAAHTADHHGADIVLGESMNIIPMKDTVCFRIGREVYCTIKTPTGAYLTTSKSVMPAATQMVNLAAVCGCDISGCTEELLGCAEYLTGDQLTRELRVVLPRIAHVKTTLVGVIRSTKDPAVCAAQALMNNSVLGSDLRQVHHEVTALQACCGMLCDVARRSK